MFCKGRYPLIAIKPCNVWNYLIRHYQKSLTTDGFTSFAFFNQIAGSMKTAPMTIELMTHPGAQAYAEETALLTSDWMTKVPYELTLINYNQLRSRYSRNPA